MDQSQQVLKLIKEGDLDGIHTILKDGLNPNQSVSCYDSYLECSFVYRQLKIAKLLIQFGTLLPSDVFVIAATSGDRELFEYLLSKGADLNAISHSGHSALSSALSSDNELGARALIDLGIDIKIVGEQALVDCAYNGRIQFLDLLISRGVDINYFTLENQMFYQGVTPLIAAVCGNQLETLIYLISNGADTTIMDQSGCRAYNYARILGYSELEDYIKLHEPHEYHDYSKRTEILINGGLPLDVIEVLSTRETRLEYQSENYSNYLILGTIFDIVYFEYYGFQLFNLVLKLDNYEAFGIVTWCPSRQQFVSVDIENEWIYILYDMTWETFLSDPGLYIDRIINQEYDYEDIESTLR